MDEIAYRHAASREERGPKRRNTQYGDALAKFRTHYDNLKVARDAPVEVIRAAYRSLSQKYHPDKNKDDPRAAEIMAIINASYKVLSDPEKRKEHDAWIVGRERNGKAASGGVRSSRSDASSASVRKPPPRQGSSARANPAVFRSGGHSAILSHLGKYRFFYFLLAMAPIAYLGVTEYKEEKVQAPQAARMQTEPRFVRPDAAENGAAWPKVSGYIRGYLRRNTDGGSQVTVDNANPNSDMLVKLFCLDEPGGKPVRVFFVRAGDRYTVKSVRKGRYDVRYRNLGTGDRFRSEPFALEEIPGREGVRYGTVIVSLYRGKQKTHPIGEEDFFDDLH